MNNDRIAKIMKNVGHDVVRLCFPIPTTAAAATTATPSAKIKQNSFGASFCVSDSELRFLKQLDGQSLCLISTQAMPTPSLRPRPSILDPAQRQAAALELLTDYETYIGLLRQHRDFTDDEIDTVSDLSNKIYTKLMHLFGYNALTNYWHIIGANHLDFYIRRWRNLHRYQHQDWEHMNHLLKRFFLTRTQRGGRSGTGRSRSSRVRSIGRWMQRRLMWLTKTVKPADIACHSLKRRRVLVRLDK